MILSDNIKIAYKKIIVDIVKGDFGKLSSDGRIGKLSEVYIKNELLDYGGIATIPPEDSYDRFLQVTQIGDTKKYKAYFELWIDNARSDLTLICDIISTNGQLMQSKTQNTTEKESIEKNRSGNKKFKNSL